MSFQKIITYDDIKNVKAEEFKESFMIQITPKNMILTSNCAGIGASQSNIYCFEINNDIYEKVISFNVTDAHITKIIIKYMLYYTNIFKKNYNIKDKRCIIEELFYIDDYCCIYGEFIGNVEYISEDYKLRFNKKNYNFAFIYNTEHIRKPKYIHEKLQNIKKVVNYINYIKFMHEPDSLGNTLHNTNRLDRLEDIMQDHTARLDGDSIER